MNKINKVPAFLELTVQTFFFSLSFHQAYHAHLPPWVTLIICFFDFCSWVLGARGSRPGTIFCLPERFVFILAGSSLQLSDTSLPLTHTEWFLGGTYSSTLSISALQVIFTHPKSSVASLYKSLANNDLDSELGDLLTFFKLLFSVKWDGWTRWCSKCHPTPCETGL